MSAWQSLAAVSLRSRARGGLLLITALWGGTFTLNALALRTMPAQTLLLLRFGAATVVLLLITGRPRYWRGLRWSELRVAIFTGLLLFGGYLAQIEGQRFISASLSGFLTGVSVILVPLFLLGVGIRPRRRQIAGTALALLGLVALSDPAGHSSLNGVGLTLGSAVCFGLQIVVVEIYAHEVSPLRFVTIQMSTVTVAAMAVLPVTGGLGGVGHSSVIAWIAVGANGIGASALAFIAQTYALRVLSSIEVAVIYSIEPVFAAVFALVVLGNSLPLLGWIGGAVVVVAMVVVSLDAVQVGSKALDL
ncbi:MAG: DMT family transporter [Ferrimicrobium sp.]